MFTIKATNLYRRNIFDTFVIHFVFFLVCPLLVFFLVLVSTVNISLVTFEFLATPMKKLDIWMETKRLAMLTTRELNHVCDSRWMR